MNRTYRALVTIDDEGLVVLTLDANIEEEGQAREDQLVIDKLLSIKEKEKKNFQAEPPKQYELGN